MLVRWTTWLKKGLLHTVFIYKVLQTLTFQLTSEFSYTQLANIEEPLTAKEKESENAQYSLSFFLNIKLISTVRDNTKVPL